MPPVELFMTDFCPFAQRAWIAFLEKESDPEHPKLFNYREVNYFNKSLPETKEFLKVHNTVPAGYDTQGNPLRESMPIVYYADQLRPKQNPLQPVSDEGKERMKKLITKFTTGAADVTVPLYQLLMEADPKKGATHSAKLLSAYAELSRELQASGGPFLMGEQFTVADIALIPFIQRALTLLPHFRGFSVPETAEYAAFHRFVAAFEARPSVRISNADRLPRSMAVQPFGAQKRKDYLIEMYSSYANGVNAEVREQLAHAPPGKSSVDIPAALRTKAAREAQARSQLRQNRAMRAVAFAAIGAVVAAKLFSVYRARN